ncbi:hypothetical protein ACJMK2_024212 [Sinanodonta woodiana]|uniref:HMG box domain-containing protein n=1 Tax=Sinanodonta woodiana TaxID=1069815 RepID=A0ABD3T6P1_SINWO
MAEGLEAQLVTLTQENAFLKKYLSLRKRCEQIQQANEKLVNRLQHVKKLIKRYKRERRYLAERLDEHGDNYRDMQVPVMWEEDQLFGDVKPTSPNLELNNDEEPTKPKGKKLKSHDRLGDLPGDRPSANILSSLEPLFKAHGIRPGGLEDVEGSTKSSSKGQRVKARTGKEIKTPSKPLNAFQMFRDENRQAIWQEYRQEHSDEIPQHELTKRLAIRWNNLSPSERQIYYDKCELGKVHFKEEFKHSLQESGEATLEQKFSPMDLSAMHLESQSAIASLIMKHDLDG